MFIIIKLEWPPSFLYNGASSSRNDLIQAEEHEAYNEYQVNDPMEKYDNNNIVQDHGTNQLIQDLFARPNDQDGDSDGIYDEPLIKKESKPLYKGSRANPLSTTLFLVNLKVLNLLLKTCMTQILRYV